MVLSMVAEMERRFIRERQQVGIEEAKRAGVYKGRRPSVSVAKVKAMRDEGHGPSAIARASEERNARSPKELKCEKAVVV